MIAKDRPAASRALVDALVLRELLSGRRPLLDPSRGSPQAYVVSWPEYLFLGELILCVGDRKPPGRKLALMRAIDELTKGCIRPTDWLGAVLDLGRVHDLHGIGIEVADPHPQAAQAVLDAMSNFHLDAREATNLVLADSEAMPFIATKSTLSAHMLAALSRSSIAFNLNETWVPNGLVRPPA